MDVLVFHGYLLHGTGSNVYNASLARALASLGHDVHLLCQDRGADELEWVDRVGTWDDGRLRVQGPERDGGSVTAYLPDIGGLLPVFVRDEYAGFRVKTFPEMSDEEIAAYVGANVAAVQEVVEAAGGVDAALANHLIMGPVVLARAGLQFALKVHGSDLAYTILPNLERFRPFALEAVEGASGILVGSGHIAARLSEAVGDTGAEKVRLGPPGVDTSLFSPLPRTDHAPRLQALAASLRDEGTAAMRRSGPAPAATVWERDLAQAADALEHFAEAEGPRVVFVGKLIVSKGADLLLAAWPLVHAENPGARLLVAGFGAYAEPLADLWRSLAAGDLDGARSIAAEGRALEGAERHPLRILGAFLEALPDGYLDAAAAAAGGVAFPGRLTHDEVGRLVPATDALVFPSTFPEAFGMVAAEAAAAGVLPVSAAHSGAAEVSRELASGLAPEARELLSFPVEEGAIEGIAERLNRWLALDEATREEAGRGLRETVVRLWSWEGVARGVLAASGGQLEDLPRPGTE